MLSTAKTGYVFFYFTTFTSSPLMHFMIPYCTPIIHDLGCNFPNNYTAKELLVPAIT